MPTPETTRVQYLTERTRSRALSVLFACSAAWGSTMFPRVLSAQLQPSRPDVAAQSGVRVAARVDGRADGRSFRADSFWVAKWFRGGRDEEDLFVEPRGLAEAGPVLAVLDQGTREVHLLSTVDGTTKRVLKAKGSGPGEFAQPKVLLRNRDQFGLLDDGNSRISMFTSAGTLVWDAPTSATLGAEGACALSRERVLIKRPGRTGALTLVDSSGKVRGRFSLADTLADETDTFGATGKLAGPFSGGVCVFAPAFGARWYAVTATGAFVSHRYVEAGTVPVIEAKSKVLERTRSSTTYRITQSSNAEPISRGAYRIGDTLVVAASATQSDPMRLLDYYLVSTGRYLYSRKLPEVYTEMTVGADGTFYGSAIGPEFSWVIALKPSRTPPPAAKKQH